MNFIHRPIGGDWRGERIPWGSRRPSPFRASWSKTLAQLDRELIALGATDVIVQLDMTEGDFRINGMPRANARPATAAVILSFKSRHGWLRYQCDSFEGGADGWQDNLRAIVLGLESLRQVERYGITKRGEQYTGWKALPAGAGDMDIDVAEAFLLKYGSQGVKPVDLAQAYRFAAKLLHPDVADEKHRPLWDQLQRAKAALGI